MIGARCRAGGFLDHASADDRGVENRNRSLPVRSSFSRLSNVGKEDVVMSCS